MSGNIVVTFHNMVADLRPISNKSPTPKVKFDILEYFDQLKTWNYEDFHYRFLNEKFCGILSNIEIDKSAYVVRLVFIVADAEADDPCVRDLKTNKPRLLKRAKTEAAEKRVHIVIKVDKKNPTLAQFAAEYERGVTARIFINTLNYFTNHARSDAVKKPYFFGEHPNKRDKNGVPEPLGYRLKFEYQSEFSEEIIEAFVNGNIKNVEFYRPAKINPQFDNQGKFQQDALKISLKVGANVVPSSAKTFKQKTDAIIQSFNNLIGQHTDLKGTVFKINFTDSNGANRYAEYDSDEQEFTLVKKKLLDEKLRQPTTDVVVLNRLLCDRMQANI
ncbi:Uncharacterised protein [Acinetobacter junii]|uniref:hypothetical protein n=1 Tax=Acinetobacter junii TaxID=40215 RepID=UPI0002CF783D|nr:hypothetical protein [Acinetobacter junii]ENV67435.1 hypothetical protein F948_00959 [Acinetobacter junii CIP 64.5]SUU19777.1 Uncharacterised protein [Acinetobacter junii]SUU22289.1 Uncharacterised protein [Acinetobacter junii]